MLRRMVNSIERLGNIGSSGPWWWRWVGGAVSVVVMVVLLLVLR